MTKCLCLLAQLEGLNPLNPTVPLAKSTGLVFKDLMVIITLGLALGLVLLLGANRYWKRKKHHRHHHPPERRTDSTPAADWHEDEENEEHIHHDRRHRRRRLRRDHRPRNPTLAETGGLPPSKTEPTSNPPL